MNVITFFPIQSILFILSNVFYQFVMLETQQ